MIGALKLTDRIDLLVEAVTAVKKVHWHKRWLLGRSSEVGFIRRNAMISLRTIGVYDDRVRRALLAALNDSYYEVRQETLRTLHAFREQVRGDAEVIETVGKLLHDRHFEVVPLAAKTYSELAVKPVSFDNVRDLLADPRWPVRAAAAQACRRLYDRGVITDAVALREALSKTMVAGEMFHPESPLKVALKQATAGLPGREE